MLEFAAEAEDDIRNDLTNDPLNPLAATYLDDTYDCKNSDTYLNVSAPDITGDDTDPSDGTLNLNVAWEITPVLPDNPDIDLSATATTTLSGSVLSDPPYTLGYVEIEVSYGDIDSILDIPLVKKFDSALKGVITALEYALPNNPDNTVSEAMKALWGDINDADSQAVLTEDCGFTNVEVEWVKDLENKEDILPQGRITSIEMGLYLQCNF